ncbi:helix-turn-helix transcriptional regulator [Sphingobacterium faecium]|uniref:LuxR C-terminal-related transcriptional regulator n=1 Tax=Sphingobacterium faecium TaxID=34087 RepID=UPI001290D063|nr:LuxR C-terminal-related transcriptional regulator [Sphingobacterium faecium]MQP28726.1 helix-turn-helix transcriptional regulator [Sphingobacterium faecium]
MNTDLQKLHRIWLETRAHQNTDFPIIGFDDLTNAIISTGPFYYYVIDFYDMSLSHVNGDMEEIHGLNPEVVTFNDVLLTIHPDDVDFVANAESFISKFFRERIATEKLLNYKMNYSFRSRMKNGEYALLNHQAILLSLDENGRSGKSLNIHTRIDHLSNLNTRKISLIGLKGEPSYLNMSLEEKPLPCFSKREKQILQLIAAGLTNNEIAEKLFIAAITVKKHRQNILEKTDCKNITQLINQCTMQGLI